MLFPTVSFALFFGCVLTVAWSVWDRPLLRKWVLIGASYVFYGAWDIRYLALMLWVSLVAYGAGILLSQKRRRWVLVLACALLMGTLGVFKYFGFFMESLRPLLEAAGLERDWMWMRFLLPVGISFYVFQAVSYVVDVWRGDVAARRSVGDILLYISFFPQLVAGPIVRATVVLPQIDAPSPPDAAERGRAVGLILIGLFKKMVIANYLAVHVVDPVFLLPDGQNMVTASLALVAYAVQIYCDFSGYSDMAIGIALLLGFRFPPNFDQPYRATSLRDFWRRWHISLSTWIRDYLYIPLGGSRSAPARVAANLIVTMTLAGLWHGAGWAFLAWGFLHGLLLAMERHFRVALPRVAGIALTFVVVTLLWLPFRADDLGVVSDMLAAMVRIEGYAPVSPPFAVWVLLVIGLALNWVPRDLTLTPLLTARVHVQVAALFLGAIACFAFAQKGVAPFIYFQF